MNDVSPPALSSAAFAVRYCTPAALAELRTPLLAEIHYGEATLAGCATAAPGPRCAHPQVHVAMSQLQAPAVEVWTSALPVTTGCRDGLHFAHNGAVLFGAYRLPGGSGFETHARATYEHLLNSIAVLGYPHLLRIWNHFPDITQAVAELDRYKVFCRARAQALAPLAVAQLPAASAVGSRGDAFVIYFLAGKQAGIAVENPRQISAYRYPPQYGPRSPAFARATWVAPAHLFISGTASILGHASMHPGDTLAQTQETLRNIAALLAACRDTVGAPLGLVNLALVKVYLRDRAAFPTVQAQLAAALPARVPVLYLDADICRADLLLEIEGIAAPAA